MSWIGKFHHLQSLAFSSHFSKQYVVIESDDWGSERIPNNFVRTELEKSGIDVNSNPHAKYDSLEKLEDLELLEEIFTEIEQLYGKKVKMTTNFICANPDFEKIRDSGFEEYFYECFRKTYHNRDGNDKVWLKINSLVENGYFCPQFHGREHINVCRWLDELQSGNKHFLKAFELGCYAIDVPSNHQHRKNLMAAFEYNGLKEQKFIESSIMDGLEIFKNSFGFPSKTIVPPRYVWHPQLENIFKLNGINHIQTALYQKIPSKNRYENAKHYTGQINTSTGIMYLTRNAHFEPAYGNLNSCVDKTMNMIKWAFRFKTPAIISTHRVNFSGNLDPKQRVIHLKLFKALLINIIHHSPNVEFITSVELANLISKNNHVRN